jgi:polyketide cyclase/dehydrase/lipid transport protein
MATVDMSTKLRASASAVWQAIGDFGALDRWHPAVAGSAVSEEQGRRVRRLSLKGGGLIVEALERHDDAARAYGYTILSGPLPVANYHSELSVQDDGGDRCTVRWRSTFEPTGSEADAVGAIGGVYQAGFDSLTKRFGG